MTVNGSDVVESVTFETETWLKLRDGERDFIKNPETQIRDLTFKTETSKFVHFAEMLWKNVVITSKLNFVRISGTFPTCFDCFFPAKKQTKKSLNYRNFTQPFLCNIQSLETCSLRDRTLNLRDRDSQKCVLRRPSRPRPSLETPSLVNGVHINSPYVKIITCIHSFRRLQNYLQMQTKTTDYCCQNFFEKQSLASDHAAVWYNGKRHYAGVFGVY